MSPARPRTGTVMPPAATGTWGDDPYARAVRSGRGPLFLSRGDGWLLPLEVERWCARADAVDLEVLRRCEGGVLDVGCGPGRLVVELAARGVPALGVDVSAAAVARTVALGGRAVRRSVFAPLPDEGRWGTALLVDGNLGIGGDPAALLSRLRELLAPGGLLIAETVPADIDERVLVRVTDAAGRSSAPSRGHGSARRHCCGTPARWAGVPSISGRPAGAASSRCAAAAPASAAAGAAAPSRRRARR
ncbi:class I SAM-dependent methyltransferase [Streptomyces thermocoprophilus]